MGYEVEIKRGLDVEFDGEGEDAMNSLDGYAVHIRYAEGSQEVFAKYSNKTVTGYEKQLIDVSLSSTPATFLIKIPRTLTATLKAKAKCDAMVYTQVTRTGYPDSDFRPASEWLPFGTTSKSLTVTTNLAP